MQFVPLLILALSATVTIDQVVSYRILCYYTNWSQYRAYPGAYTVSNIDTTLCTHVSFAFAVMTDSQLSVHEYNDAEMYAQLLAKKKTGDGFKTLLAVGGWSYGTARFTAMASNHSTRQIFVQSAVSFLREHGFDGLEMNWQYPGSLNSPPEDKQRFTMLCQELLDAFVADGVGRGTDRLTLTAAVSAGKEKILAGYEISVLANILDWVNLMAYDLHGPWENETGLHSALFGDDGDVLTVDHAVKMWLNGGMPPEKINLGMPAYGRSFQLAQPSSHGLHAPAVGPGLPGLLTREPGFLAYYEICGDSLTWNNKIRDPSGRQVYSYDDRGRWVSFDDDELFNDKCSYIRNNSLGGAAVWSLDLDDYSGLVCDSDRYPLLNAISTCLRPITTTPAIVPTTEIQPSTSEGTGKKVVCYYTNWAQYRTGKGSHSIQNIDTSLCTHISFAFAVIRNLRLSTFEYNDLAMYSQLLKKKKENSGLVTLLAVGGSNFGTSGYTEIFKNSSTRSIFIDSSVRFLRTYGFNGLDLHWTYSSAKGSSASDKQKFTALCKELQQAFLTEADRSGKPKLLLVAAVSANEDVVNNAYDVAELAGILDWVNLQAYDLHGAWENVTGLHSPLYSNASDDKLTVNRAVQLWLSKGMPSNKLLLGVPSYGRTFTLRSTVEHGLEAGVTGPGAKGTYTNDAGFFAYYEICNDKAFWSNERKDIVGRQMYSWNGQGIWVSFDDLALIYEKCLYIAESRLGGAAIWSLDLDDFTGTFCNSGAYPLTRAMSTCLRLTELFEPVVQTLAALEADASLSVDLPSINSSTHSPKIICYFANWAQYRPGAGAYTGENVNASLCTHLSYAFATLKEGQIYLTEWNDQDTLALLRQAKKQNQDLKLILALGGANFDIEAFTALSLSNTTRWSFVLSTILFLRAYGFDGLEIDWEHPGFTEISAQDKQSFTSLCKDLKTGFIAEGRVKKIPRLSLSASVSASNYTIVSDYDIPALSRILDWINVMGYDFHGSWNAETGLHSAMYPSGRDDHLNVHSAIETWLTEGMPAKKIVLSIPAYGRSFNLNSSFNGVAAPASGPGKEGQYTKTAGIYSYYEICTNHDFQRNIVRDPVTHGVYSWDSLQNWVSFDDIDSLNEKCQYVKSNGLAGVALWTLDLDDFSGSFCNSGGHPALAAASQCLRASQTARTVAPATTTLKMASGNILLESVTTSPLTAYQSVASNSSAVSVVAATRGNEQAATTGFPSRSTASLLQLLEAATSASTYFNSSRLTSAASTVPSAAASLRWSDSAQQNAEIVWSLLLSTTVSKSHYLQNSESGSSDSSSTTTLELGTSKPTSVAPHGTPSVNENFSVTAAAEFPTSSPATDAKMLIPLQNSTTTQISVPSDNGNSIRSVQTSTSFPRATPVQNGMTPQGVARACSQTVRITCQVIPLLIAFSHSLLQLLRELVL